MTQAAILSGKNSMAKESRGLSGHNLRGNQPELSRYADYLIANVNPLNAIINITSAHTTPDQLIALVTHL